MKVSHWPILRFGRFCFDTNRIWSVIGVQNRPVPFPSREKGTALPRPRPTILSEVAKGKRRQKSLSSEDWVPNASEDGNDPDTSSIEELEEEQEDDKEGELFDMDFTGEDQEEEDIAMIVSAGSGENAARTMSADDDSDDGARSAIARMLVRRNEDRNTLSTSTPLPAASNARQSVSHITDIALGNGNDQDLCELVH